MQKEEEQCDAQREESTREKAAAKFDPVCLRLIQQILHTIDTSSNKFTNNIWYWCYELNE
jgi:hypothetical protein